jgi:hypothetical protein
MAGQDHFLMYSYGLGLQKVSEFFDHDGFKGIMLAVRFGLAY